MRVCALLCPPLQRAPCMYCIGCSSIFLVVAIAAAAQTLVSKVPLIFLREAEAASGQVDVRITPDEYLSTATLNYTRFAAAVRAEEYSYHAPRLTVPAVVANVEACDFPTSVEYGLNIHDALYYSLNSSRGGLQDCGVRTCMPR
ncbi:hypothetical protein EON67_09125, partial [archaeon]